MALLRFCFVVALLIAGIPDLTRGQSTGSITSELLARFDKRLADDPGLKRVINAATNNDIRDLSLNRELISTFDGRFNFELKGTKIIDQKGSGRCWMFAGCNVITPRVMTKLKLSDFGLSQAYVAFYDRLEKCNFFLETMISLRDRDINDRALQMYLENPIGDGGWWQYFEGLIRKYGVVPASAMPETKQSSATDRTNSLLNTLLRKATQKFGECTETVRRNLPFDSTRKACSQTSTACLSVRTVVPRRSSFSDMKKRERTPPKRLVPTPPKR